MENKSLNTTLQLRFKETAQKRYELLASIEETRDRTLLKSLKRELRFISKEAQILAASLSNLGASPTVISEALASAKRAKEVCFDSCPRRGGLSQ